MTCRYELGQLVKGPEFAGRVFARTEHWDGRIEYLVRNLYEREGVEPPSAWIAQGDLKQGEDEPLSRNQEGSGSRGALEAPAEAYAPRLGVGVIDVELLEDCPDEQAIAEDLEVGQSVGRKSQQSGDEDQVECENNSYQNANPKFPRRQF